MSENVYSNVLKEPISTSWQSPVKSVLFLVSFVINNKMIYAAMSVQKDIMSLMEYASISAYKNLLILRVRVALMTVKQDTRLHIS